jgi:hypothetical protein
MGLGTETQRKEVGMTDWHKFYDRWIEDCVASAKEGESRNDLLRHIQKHAGPDLMNRVLGGEEADWVGWIASMHNLLAIFERRMLGRGLLVEEKLSKMRKSWAQDPERFQGPPGSVEA